MLKNKLNFFVMKILVMTLPAILVHYQFLDTILLGIKIFLINIRLNIVT